MVKRALTLQDPQKYRQIWQNMGKYAQIWAYMGVYWPKKWAKYAHFTFKMAKMLGISIHKSQNVRPWAMKQRKCAKLTVVVHQFQWKQPNYWCFPWKMAKIWTFSVKKAKNVRVLQSKWAKCYGIGPKKVENRWYDQNWGFTHIHHDPWVG